MADNPSIMIATIPTWLQATTLDSLPTRALNNNIIQCQLKLPKDWDHTPKMEFSKLLVEHFFEGNQPLDGLVMSFIEAADPAADLKDWIEMPIQLGQHPFPVIQQAFSLRPTILKWENLLTPIDLQEQLALDELALYEGIMQDQATGSQACWFAVLARRTSKAWLIGLSLKATHTYTGTAIELALEDQQRAAAIFNGLKFL